MTWAQFQGWLEYFSLEPFGEEAAWLRHGMLCSLIANVNRDPRKGKPYEPIMFMPFADEGAGGRKRRKPGQKVTREEQSASWASFVGSVKKHLKPRRTDKEH